VAGSGKLLYLFEDCGLDTDRRELYRATSLVSVEPKVFDLLAYIIRNREHVVSKDDLIAIIWNGRIVSESALTTCINAARTAIGDSGEAQRLIKTLPRKGIRFVGIVREEEGKPAAVAPTVAIPEPLHPSPALPDKPSIAVLPFVNMSGDPEQEYFTDGMTEDIITELSRFRSFLVISRPSSFTYRGRSVNVQAVGRELGVHYVVEGSVRKAGGRVRVTVQLIDTETGNHLWAERYDRDLADIFSIQDEVTQNIVANLAGRLDDAGAERALRKSSENVSKYDLLLKGKYFLNRGSKEDIARARELFEQAIELDPNDARAYVGLAGTYLAESRSDWTGASSRRAFDLACKAVDLDDRDSQAHLLLAWTYLRAKSNFDLAASQVDKAITLNPNDYNNYCFKGWLLTCSGDLDGGIVCTNEALRRNPLVPDECLHTIGVADYLAGRYERALSAFGKMTASHHPDVCAFMAACYAQLGREDEARLQAEEFLHRAKLEFVEYPAQNMESWRAYWMKRMPVKEAAQLDSFLGCLRRAGLPK
jgi:TolB-like protein/Flp pilus assembly protein TadD